MDADLEVENPLEHGRGDGIARTSSYQSKGGVKLHAPAIGASAVAGQQYSFDHATTSMIDLTKKIRDYQYG
jgi:hypothetical protein